MQPNNPTGLMYSEDCLKMCLDFAYKNKLHVIGDEVYAISIFPGQKMLSLADVADTWASQGEDAAEKQEFVKNYTHILYGMSKDFGLSGFRVGVLYT